MNFESGNESKTSRTLPRLRVAGAVRSPSNSDRPPYERSFSEPDEGETK
jgi:hypothetical protein